MSLQTYVDYLISKDGDYPFGTQYNLSDVLKDYAEIEAFNEFARKRSDPLSSAAIMEIRHGRKISAIKMVRQNLMDSGQEYGLKIAKDIVDKYILDNPYQF